MAIRRILVEPGVVDLGPQADGVDVVTVSSPLDLGPCAPNEVLVVGAGADLLAEAGERGVHRIVPDEPPATGTAAAVRELVALLERDPPDGGGG